MTVIANHWYNILFSWFPSRTGGMHLHITVLGWIVLAVMFGSIAVAGVKKP